MAKRYYKEKELVWMVEDKTKATIISLDVPNLSARVEISGENGAKIERTVKFMEIDKLRENQVINKTKNTATHKDTILFAKVKEDAKIPSKRLEDAGYDIYANFEEERMVLLKGEANLVPTGIASSLLPKYYFNIKHERGSTAKWGMAVLAGVVDSGYRGEWFVNIVPTKYNVIISKTFDFPVKDGVQKPCKLDDDTIMYPYSLAIAQGTLDLVPDVRVKEITYEQLKAIPSQRGDGKIGSSGK